MIRSRIVSLAAVALAGSACIVDAGEIPADDTSVDSQALEREPCGAEVKARFMPVGAYDGTLRLGWYTCSNDARASLAATWWLTPGDPIGYVDGILHTSHGSYRATGRWDPAASPHTTMMFIAAYDTTGAEVASIEGDVYSHADGLPATFRGHAYLGD